MLRGGQSHRYGAHRWARCELHLPRGDGPFPVVIALHGGSWKAGHGKALMRPVCRDLVRRGWAAWNVEYRRMGGGQGGGWPATFDDVAAAVDHLAMVDAPVDLQRVVLLGHSAGGHLALWAAGRSDPAPHVIARAVVGQAAVANLERGRGLTDPGGLVNVLLGGTPDEVPERYAAANPMRRIPLSVPVLLVHGPDDGTVSVGQSRDYAEAASAAGGTVELVEPAAAGHRDHIDPRSTAWAAVTERLGALVGFSGLDEGRCVTHGPNRSGPYPARAVGRYVVKLGSNIVARDDGSLRDDVLEHICAEVAQRHAAGDDVVIVTSAAIALGMRVMKLDGRPSAMADLQAASAVGQGKLYRVYDELLREREVISAQVLLTFFDMSARTHYLNARRTLRKLLDWRVIPVINENDTTTTDEISFGDNDFLAAQVAVLLGADLLVLLTDIDGLYTADPRHDEQAELVEEVEDFAALERLSIGHAGTEIGSGGMRSKVVAAEMATAAGIPTVICNGTRAGSVARAVAGEREGTRFAAQATRASSFKLWLKYAKPSHGSITVDAGAARALRESGTSLLPVGIVGVSGEFDAGDAVDVHSDGVAIGKGICNYTAAELRQIMGLKSDAVRELMPRASDEAVHRDYFVLT